MGYVILALVLLMLDLGIKKAIDEMPEDKFPLFMGKKKEIKLQKFYNKGLPYGFLQGRELFTKWMPLALTLFLCIRWCMLLIGNTSRLKCLGAEIWLYLNGKKGRAKEGGKKAEKGKTKRSGSGTSFLEKLGLSFVIAGAFSNLADRFTKGYVVDYVSTEILPSKKLKETVFNLGDLWIVIGCILGFVRSMTKKNKKG